MRGTEGEIEIRHIARLAEPLQVSSAQLVECNEIFRIAFDTVFEKTDRTVSIRGLARLKNFRGRRPRLRDSFGSPATNEAESAQADK